MKMRSASLIVMLILVMTIVPLGCQGVNNPPIFPADSSQSTVSTTETESPATTAEKSSYFQIYYYGDQYVLIEDPELADNLIAAIDAGPTLLPKSYSNLHSPIVKVYQNNELRKEISLGCSEGIFFAHNSDRREPGYYMQPPYTLPAEITQNLEAYMLDQYLTIRTWDCQLNGGPVIAADRIQNLTISNLANSQAFTYLNNGKDAEIINQLVDLYNQSHEVILEHFNADNEDMPKMSESEQAIRVGQDFTPVYSTEIKFINGDRLQIQTGELQGVHKLTLQTAGDTIKKNDLESGIVLLSGGINRAKIGSATWQIPAGYYCVG